MPENEELEALKAWLKARLDFSDLVDELDANGVEAAYRRVMETVSEEASADAEEGDAGEFPTADDVADDSSSDPTKWRCQGWQ